MNSRILHCLVLCTALIWLQPGAAQQAAEQSGGSAFSDFQLVKSKHVPPQYPRRAVDAGREGWVDLAITVEPDGSISNVAVLAAMPKRVFERPAIRAVKKWKFEPPADSGVDQPITRTYRVSFQLVD